MGAIGGRSLPKQLWHCGLEHIMPPTVKVKSNDAVTKVEREATAEQVLAHFGNRLPDLRLLCFMDNDDWQPFKDHGR